MACGRAPLFAALAASIGVFVASAGATAVAEEAALPVDDECADAEDSETCALSAVQLRATARKLAGDEAAGALSHARAKHEQVQVQREAIMAMWQAEEDKAVRRRAAQAAQQHQSPELGSPLPGPAPGSYAKHDTDSAATPKQVKWNGGGMVDDMNGEDQVEIMARRDADWHMGRIIYQVFVDRWVKPTKSLKEIRELHTPPQTVHPWSQPVFGGKPNEETKYYTNELAYWGGDLQGVISKLDYIQEFADILYLQPIFTAFSSHKYDTTDYFTVDKAYGNLTDFYELVDEVHKKHMHLVLDGVFNHMGIRSTLFKDALADPNSKYRNWFFIGPEYGKQGYKAWQNGGTLAELRLEDKDLENYIWGSKDSVIATWLNRGADGFRLDVGTEIGREFLWDLTKAAHGHKYGSLVVGEVSAYPRWWTESMDGVLSFWMGWVIEGVVSGRMGGVFAGMQIEQLIQESSMEQVLRSWIIVSNHDLPRLTSVYPDVDKRKFALQLQYTLPGAVCIYYGEEIGMEGAGDPFNRAPMEWDKVNDQNEFLNFTRTLVNTRRSARALRIGDFHTLRSFSLLAFIRRTDRIDEIVIVLANPTENVVEERLVVPVEDILEYTLFKDAFTGTETRIRGGTIEMKVPPHTARVMQMVHEPGPNGNQYKRIYGHWDTFKDVTPMASLGNGIGDLV